MTITTEHATRPTRPTHPSRSAPAAGSGAGPADRDGGRTAVAGILTVEGNRAVLRTEGLLPSAADVPVPIALVRRAGLREGDFVCGERPGGGGGARPLGAVETVNGQPPGALAGRPHFADLTPVHPSSRLRLETGPKRTTARVVDLIAPIGKGQRGLIVAPPKAGKTMVLRALAEGLAANHPECHVMAVLVDERPEEVTEMARSVPAEVLASTFDRSAREHIALAALAVERAKRLAELGRDTVILLDSLTRLCRAHNNRASSGGRTLSGGVDAGAVQGPKRLFGAARDLEGAGSVTILATALTGTGSRADDYFFEELKSTGNMELRLDRVAADRRVFPAVDTLGSGTRREELLLPPDELAAVRSLRRVLHARDPQQGLDLLLDQLARTPGNADFLRRLSQTVPDRR